MSEDNLLNNLLVTRVCCLFNATKFNEFLDLEYRWICARVFMSFERVTVQLKQAVTIPITMYNYNVLFVQKSS